MRKLSYEELLSSRPSLAEVQQRERHPIHVVVDNVRSLHNVGSIFRTSDGAGIEKLYLCGLTGKPPRPEIRKTALGAEESVAWEYHARAVDIVKELKRKGVYIVVLEHTNQSINCYEANFLFPACLVIGHEHFGVSDEVIALADLSIEIPMFGLKSSLNVSVAYGIVVYEMVRQLGVMRSGL